MVGVAWLALAFGLIRSFPLLGIPLSIVVWLTEFRTHLTITNRIAAGRAVELEDTFEIFGRSLQVALLTLMIAMFAFFGLAIFVALGILHGSRRAVDPSPAVISGALAAAVAGSLVLRRTWPDRD